MLEIEQFLRQIFSNGWVLSVLGILTFVGGLAAIDYFFCEKCLDSKNVATILMMGIVGIVYKFHQMKKRVLPPEDSPVSNPPEKCDFKPPYLPFLINRDEQIKCIRQRIEEHESNSLYKYQPLLCFLEGDNQAAHYDFMKCLVEEYYNYTVIKEFKTGFRDLEKIDIKKWHDYILSGLINSPQITENPDKLVFDKNGRKVFLVEHLARSNQYHCLFTHIPLDKNQNFSKTEKFVEQGFIKFWETWNFPREHKDFRLWIFIFLEHTSHKKVMQELKILRNLRESNSDVFCRYNVDCVFPPTLDGIHRESVNQWLDKYEMNIIRACNTTRAAVEKAINQLYKKGKPLPMKQLAEGLEKILSNQSNKDY